MSDPKEMFAGHPASSRLSPEELEIVASRLEIQEFAAGDEVSVGSESTQSILFVIEGAVELIVPIVDDVERIFETARAGTSLGLVAFFDQKPSIGQGRAAEDTVVLELTRAAADELYQEHPETTLHLTSFLVRELCTRVRVLGAQFVHSVAWGLQISGAIHLNLQRIIADETVVVLELVSGKSVSGILLRVDETDGGTDVFLREEAGDLVIIPWRSVTVARIPGKLVDQVAAETMQGN
jgi:signal-transduction protein with cAMP-binding, CBS, and nucleotidyltransferase domain